MPPNEAERRPTPGAANHVTAAQPLHTLPPIPDECLDAWTAGYLAGYERGYEIRGDEANAAWPPPKVLVFGRWFDQATERQKWDAAVRAEAGS